MVERILKNAGQIVTKNELNELLENKVMWQTMEVILKYLEDSGKIIIGKKGILWIYNENPLMKKLKGQGFDFQMDKIIRAVLGPEARESWDELNKIVAEEIKKEITKSFNQQLLKSIKRVK